MTVKTSTSIGKSGESAQPRAKHWREPFDTLRQSVQDFHSLLDSLLTTSSPGLQGVPASPLCPSDSESVP